MGKLQVIVGGQYGSEGKGAIAAYLAGLEPRLVAVRVAGPNAGHTVIDPNDGKPWRLRSVPVAAVANGSADLVIAPGSEIDLEVLNEEMHELEIAGYDVRRRLTISDQATILENRHRISEEQLKIQGRIGSTSKGIGAARSDRIMRTARLASAKLATYRHVEDMLLDQLELGVCVQIEGTQGYALGLHAGYYPYCTSSDCRAIDFLAMAGISPWANEVTTFEVWVVLRTYPIRVAGNSGPMKGETSWEDLASATTGYIQPERTTVTQKIRRVGEWDLELAQAAIEANGGPSENVKVALTFADYWYPGIAGVHTFHPSMMEWVGKLESELETKIELIGTGPDSVIDRRG